METEKKNGRGKKEVSLLGLFGKKFLEETQGKLRSEERRVGKECRSRWSPYH